MVQPEKGNDAPPSTSHVILPPNAAAAAAKVTDSEEMLQGKITSILDRAKNHPVVNLEVPADERELSEALQMELTEAGITEQQARFYKDMVKETLNRFSEAEKQYHEDFETAKRNYDSKIEQLENDIKSAKEVAESVRSDISKEERKVEQEIRKLQKNLNLEKENLRVANEENDKTTEELKQVSKNLINEVQKVKEAKDTSLQTKELMEAAIEELRESDELTDKAVADCNMAKKEENEAGTTLKRAEKRALKAEEKAQVAGDALVALKETQKEELSNWQKRYADDIVSARNAERQKHLEMKLGYLKDVLDLHKEKNP